MSVTEHRPHIHPELMSPHEIMSYALRDSGALRLHGHPGATRRMRIRYEVFAALRDTGVGDVGLYDRTIPREIAERVLVLVAMGRPGAA